MCDMGATHGDRAAVGVYVGAQVLPPEKYLCYYFTTIFLHHSALRIRRDLPLTLVRCSVFSNEAQVKTRKKLER